MSKYTVLLVWLLLIRFLLQIPRSFSVKLPQEVKIYSTGACDVPNPCQNNCTCVSVGNVDYYCNNSLNGFLGKNCSKSPPRVLCEDELITISVPKWFVSDMTSHYRPKGKVGDDIMVYVSSFDVTPLNDEKCVAKEHVLQNKETVYKLAIKSPFHACGMTSKIYKDDDNIETVVFENSLWWRRSRELEEQLPFSLYRFKCKYKDKKLIKSLVNPTCCDGMSIATSFGKVRLDVKFWATLRQNQITPRPLAPPFTYLVNQTIFVTVSAVEETYKSNFNSTLMDCYVSASFQSGSTSNLMGLIEQGCPIENNIADAKLVKNGEGIGSTFSFRVVPIENATHFYLHCQARICERNCATKCDSALSETFLNETATNENKTGSFRESILQRTIGPVKIREQRKQKNLKKQNVTPQPIEDSPSVTQKWAFPLIMVFTNFTCVALLGVLCYTIARSVEAKRRTRFRRLNIESLFISTDLSAVDDDIAICRDQNCSLKCKKKFKPNERRKCNATLSPIEFTSSTQTF